MALRQKYVVPLLASSGGDVGRVVQMAEGFLAVSWSLPAGTLSIALNIGVTPQPIPRFPGKTLFAWPQEEKELPQNAIIVRLASGDAQ